MQKIDADTGWIEIVDYISYRMGYVRKFLLDVYGDARGWEVMENPRHSWNKTFIRKRFGDVWHSYVFSDDIIITPLDLKFRDGHFYYENVCLSGEFGKFVMRNMDKLKPFYKRNGDKEYLCCDWLGDLEQ